MSHNVTLFQILVQSYVYLLSLDWVRNGSKYSHPPNPSKFTPFVWRVYFNTCLLVRIPGLFCVRGMFKIFVVKIVGEFVNFTGNFHLSICNNPSKRPAKLSTTSQKRPVKRSHGSMGPTKLHVFGGSTRHQKMAMCMI